MKRLKIEIVGDAKVDFALALGGVAEALKDELQAAILRQPGDKWKKTDALRMNLVAGEDSVTVSGAVDRLRDGRVADLFAEQVMPVAPLSAAAVRKASEAAIAAAVKEK